MEPLSRKAKPVTDQYGASILCTGDLVLLKCQLKETDMYAEAGEADGDTGWVCADGLRGQCSIAVAKNLHTSSLDVREFLFVVVEQLNYIAMKDLARCRKHLARQAGDLTASQAAQVKTLEERALIEAEHNAERRQSGVKPLAYGEIIQLQHLRTKRFLRICKKKQANLQKTSRMVDLHDGTASSWLRLNPFFKHKSQGVPITLGEQLLLESVNLGNNWSLNWARCRNIAKEEVYEVNCAKQGRGFYIELYSRSVAQDLKVLSCPSPLRLQHPHHSGLVSASCHMGKSTPYLRRPAAGGVLQNAKDIWVIEPVMASIADTGIEWDVTQVLLRHFGSGRYLAACLADLEAAGVRQPLGEVGGRPVPKRALLKQSSKLNANARTTSKTPAGGSDLRCELVETPSYTSWFVMEPCYVLDHQSIHLIPRGGHVMLRWDEPTTGKSFWLSCQGLRKGDRQSMHLHWSPMRYMRDAIRFDVLDDPIDIMDDSPFIGECDVVAEHTKLFRTNLTPRIKDFTDNNVAALVCAQCEHALTDMIFFLTGSPHWRASQRGDQQYVEPDPLNEPHVGRPARQLLALDLKYIDATFEMFHEFVAHVPALVEGDTRWGRRAVMLNLSMYARPRAPATGDVDAGGWSHVMDNMVACMKTRCLKLMVRLWMCCFIGSRKIEHYFFKNGWVDTINTLNGHGLGASDVFVALLSNNVALVRQVDKSTLLKFIDFIRALGPLDTWMSFLTAVCAPAEVAVGAMQQMVLSTLVFAGLRATDEDTERTTKNRKELLISARLMEGSPLPYSLGSNLAGAAPPPLEQCLGQLLLVEGLSDIAVSWTHPYQWVVGRSVLYHGPAALNLSPVLIDSDEEGNERVWVSMAELVWVLQPDHCCPLVLGKSYEDIVRERGGPAEFDEGDVFRTLETATAASGQIERLKTLAGYYLSQLQLVSDLVKERQMNCIMSLQEEYPFRLCICGISDQRLPTSIRAAFCDILTDLWLDRYPHTEVVVPPLMRNLESYSSDLDQLPRFCLHNPEPPDAWSKEHEERLPEELLAFYRLGTPFKMEAVVRAVRKYLSAGIEVEQQVHTDTDGILLMSAMLRIVSKLLRFGFIHNVALLNATLGPLLRCLDGRTDLLAPLGHRAHADAHDDRGDFHMEVPEPMTPLLEASRREEARDAAASGGGRRLSKARFPPVEDGFARYEAGDENRKLMECKVQMLELALHINKFIAHTRGSHILDIFRTMVLNSDQLQSARAMGSGAVLPPGVMERISRAIDCPAVDLTASGIRNPFAMIVDLMMYRHPQMFSLALELLFAVCCPTEATMDLLDKVELVTTPQIGSVETIREDIATLGKLVYSFEIWGVSDEYSEVDNTKFMQVQRICLKLRGLALVGDASSTSVEIQKMMHETEFFSHFQYIISLDPTDHPASSRPLLAKVTGLICSLARSFVSTNQKHQMLIHGVLDKGLWLLDKQPDMALLAVAIFRDNKELCQRVTPDLVAQFADLIVRDRKGGKTGPWYLMFFKSIVVAERVAIAANQSMVIEAIKRKPPGAMLHLLPGEAGLERVVQLANSFNSMGHLRDPEASRWVGGEDGELIYYITSVEVLIGVAMGTGQQLLVNRPFVSTLFPATSVMRLLLRTGNVIGQTPREPTFMTIHMWLKTIWLKLARLLLYDMEKNMIDIDLIASPLHVEFFGVLLSWIEDALHPKRNSSRGSRDQLVDDMQLLSEEQEEHLRAMLHAVDDFFKNLYEPAMHYEICAPLAQVTARYAQFFIQILRETAGVTGPACGLRDVSLLRITAHRVVSVVSPARASDFERHVPSKQVRGRRNAVGKNPGEFSSDMEAQWHTMLEAFMDDPHVRARKVAEEVKIGQILTRIMEITDPEHTSYSKCLPIRMEDSLPDGVDFRRTLVTTQDILERFVLHAQDHLMDDLPTLRLIQRALLATLKGARDAEDVPLLLRLQAQFVDAGVTNLIIRMLHVRVSDDITENAWILLAELLCTGYHDGSQWVAVDDESISLVNKVVQQGILDVCIHGDDSGMWECVKEVYDSVSKRIKYSHGLRRLPSLTEDEAWQIANYERALAYCVRVMETVRLMVEGHDFQMQQYLYSQAGNSRSCNVPEVTATLLMRVCKDPSAPDAMDTAEVEFLCHNLTLLQELAQGPNLRNQELLSTMGVVETCFAMCNANFERVQRLMGDIYPSTIRRVKCALVNMVLSLLEMRQDTSIHKTLLQRVDTLVVRERLEFAYLYFVFGCRDTTHDTEESPAAVPLGSREALLLASSADPSVVHAELMDAAAYAEELLEDLQDTQLDELFSEGLCMLELIYLLAPHSHRFKQDVYPVEEAEDNFPQRRADFHGSDREYEQERTAFHQRANFRLAWAFMTRFVKTIEVVLDGHLQPLHFRQPITAMWYVQEATKQHILDTIPYSSPDIKAKAFIQMCITAHTESKLIRDLSRFSVVSGMCLTFAQRHLPDGMHRPFQVFLADDAKMMSRLLRVNLMLGVCLALHVGTFLEPQDDTGDGEVHAGSRWSSLLTERIGDAMGGLYFILSSLWIFVTLCIKVPLKTIELQAAHTGRQAAIIGKAFFSVLQDTFVVWRCALLIFSGIALFQRHYWIFTFLLLDCFCQNSLLATVLAAIKAKFGSLVMTFFGAAVVTNIYASIGFHFFREEFGQYCSDNIFTCTQNILYQGTRNGIVGLSGMMKISMPGTQEFPERMIFDISYFIVFGIMILNTIVGLIVDSFGALRLEQEARLENQSTQTFVSSLDRKRIETAAQAQGISNGFEYHEENNQNKWDYMALIFYLREKRLHDYTGPEQAIRTLVEAGDYKWMPLLRSRMVEVVDEDGVEMDNHMLRIEARLHRVAEAVDEVEGWRSVARTLMEFRDGVAKRMDRLQEEIETLRTAVDNPVPLIAPPPARGGIFSNLTANHREIDVSEVRLHGSRMDI